MKVYMLKRYHARIAEAKQILGGKCIICETSEDLQIDHIDWCQKDIKLNRLWSCAKEKFLAELKKCQLLCDLHHKQKSKADRIEQRAIALNKRTCLRTSPMARASAF